MASTGGGKMRQKRSHGASKPYQRTQPKSFLDRVKDLVTPSWLSSMWSSDAQHETHTQPFSTKASTSSSNSLPPRQSIRDGQYCNPTETESEPGPSTKLTEAEKVSERGDEQLNTPVLPSFGGLSVPVSTSTPIDVDEEIIEIDSGEGTSTQKVEDTSEISAPPSVVSSLYPNLDKLEHQQKLSESNLELLSEMGHRHSPMPSSGLWSHTPSSRSATTQVRPASPFNRPQQPAISTRRPVFNASYFGTPRGSLRTSSSMESASSSPFYPGKTTYGGAAAQRSATLKRTRTSPYEVHLPIKRSVRPRMARPAAESDMGITSNTAKRILDTLEKMSTPLSDAKRIPLSPSASPLAIWPSRTTKLRAPTSPHRTPRAEHQGCKDTCSTCVWVEYTPQREYSTQQTAPPPYPYSNSTAEDESQDVEKDAATSRSSSAPAPAMTIGKFSFRHDVPAVSTQAPPPISRLDTTPVQPLTNNRSSSGGKMKVKWKNGQKTNPKEQAEDTVEVVDLPNVPLPLKTMPSFSFGQTLQPPKSTAPSASISAMSSSGHGFRFTTSTPAIGVSAPAAKKDEGSHEFTFASPILKQTSTISAPEFETTEAFTFSLPKQPEDSPSMASSKPLNFVNPSSSTSKSSLPSAAAPSFRITKVQSPGKDNEDESEESEYGIKPAKTLKTGSCLEVLGIIAPAETAMTTSQITVAPANDPFAKLKPPAGAWNCDTCLVQNKANDSTCLACQTPKPASEPQSNATSTTSDSAPVSSNDLLAKVKPCLLQNKKEADKCVACETPKPAEMQKTASPPLSNSLLDRFRPTPGSWECNTCLIKNKSDADKCISCTTPKPGACGLNPPASSNALTNSSAKGGLGTKLNPSDVNGTNSSVSTKTDNVMDKFKSPSVSWTCDTCLIQNKESADRCIACETPKPGSQPTLKTPPVSAFKFGSQSVSGSSSTAGSFKFGGTNTDSTFKFSSGKLNVPSDGLTFGAPKTSTSGIQFGLSKDNTSSGFKFGSSSDSQTKTNSSTAADGITFSSDKANKSDSGLKLGAQAVSAGESTQDTPTVSSSFQFGSASTKSDSVPPNVDPFKTASSSKTSFGSGLGANTVTTDTQETDSIAKQKQGFTFGSSKGDTPKVNFGSSVTDQNQTGAKFSFGAKAPTDDATKPTTFQFTASTNSPASTSQDSVEKPTLKFGASSSVVEDAPKLVSVSSGFSFGGAAVNATDSTQQLSHQNSVAPTFQFGKPNSGSDEAGTGHPPLKKGVTFASPVEQQSATEVKSAFAFGGTPSEPSTSQPTPFVFGTTDKGDTASKPNGGITFGTPTQTTAPTQSVEPFTFGAGTNNSKSASFNFSASSNQNAAPASDGFKFGSTSTSVASTPTQQNPPAFGGFSSSASSSNTTFGSAFGSQPATNSTSNPFGGQQSSQASVPAFGAPSGTSVFGSSATPAFGATASAGSSGSSTPTFGAGGAGTAPGFGSATPSFGSGTVNTTMGFQPEAAPSFNFGGSNPSSGTTPGVFTFGASNNQNAVPTVAAPQAATTGGYNFGQSASGFGMQGGAQNAAGAPASGVFQFGSNQSQPQAPGASFTFGAAAGTGQRKFRKAVRRTRKT
ncbi:LOW QUALITY PROTEIN: nuclear pore complex protein Nup153-like [Acanthaster planci]|uniref:Nuclear pore complex protein Nup153 n=1 Tax=Acanthaster planci TaxID=133434 RepID=A0A8B7YDD9_ACAPL|nr:LOW QUALITY PROTEIN: nuclear pore complex protein Nup153-like [Acanthaster planci]